MRVPSIFSYNLWQESENIFCKKLNYFFQVVEIKIQWIIICWDDIRHNRNNLSSGLGDAVK